MKTRLPFSTISYNTPAFLKSKLIEYKRAHIISQWFFIQHKPESDEGGNKLHIHLFINPAKSVQTDILLSDFDEFDPLHPDKPFRCMTAHSSKFPDWYLYAIHDADYLASKQQSRIFHYSESDIVAFDSDELHCEVSQIDMLDLTPFRKLRLAQEQGLTFQQYFARGGVPIQQIRQFQYAWEILASHDTNRNGRQGHSVDFETGEVFSDEDLNQVEFDPPD